MMKILHVLYSGLGGHGNVFFSMVDADRKKELQYEALFFGIEDVRQGYIEKSIARNIPWYFVKKKPGIDLSAYRRIRDIIKQSAPDIIFIHSSAYILPVKRAAMSSPGKIRIIVRETQPSHLKTKQEWIGLCLSLLTADKVVFLSGEYKRAIRKTLSLFFNEKRTVVIPNGIDLDIYKPVHKDDKEFIAIGMQSRLSGTKDHSTLIKAFHLVLQRNPMNRKLKLFIAGDGDCRPALEALTKELSLEDNIVFTGMLEEKDLAAFINSLDIYVHATLGEMMSTAIMQVMACRLPIVASDVPGVNNMIRDNINGLLVPPSDIQKMAEAISLLLANNETANILAEAAYQFAIHNYSNKLMFERYKAVFSEQ